MTSNRSFASQLKYSIMINRCPNVTFFIQEANVPGLTIGKAKAVNPFTHINFQGDHMEWSPLRISFKVDEDFINWYEIYQWIVGMSFPRKHLERYNLEKGLDKNLSGLPLVPTNKQETQRPVGDIYSQIVLSVLNSKNNPIIEFQFVDAWPLGLSEIEINAKDDDVQYLTAQVSFSYSYYNVSKP